MGVDNRELKTNRYEAIEAVLTLAVAASPCGLPRCAFSSTNMAHVQVANGTGAIPWREVSRLFISWRQRYLARVIPLYRAYRIEVVDRKGNRLVFGNRFHDAPTLAERIAGMAGEQITPRLMVDFGGSGKYGTGIPEILAPSLTP
jgi:hypothetical protein